MAKKGGAPENLDPVRTKEEAKKRGRNGGKKSGEARRKKRDAKSAAKLILDMSTTGAISQNLKKMGIEDEDLTNRVAVMSRAFTKAMTGDINAMRFLMEMAGEKPEQVLNEKRFKLESGETQKNSTVVDDWIASIPDVDDGDGEDNGEE